MAASQGQPGSFDFAKPQHANLPCTRRRYLDALSSSGRRRWFAISCHGPWLAFKRAVDAEDWPSAGASLDRIRQIISINLPLG
jgi:hypothetical protein